MIALFSLTLFLSAFLLFLVEPMFGRMTLPLLGGTPAVWNTCLVFFQTALLAGYAYAHLSSRLQIRFQVPLHFALILIASISLPIGVAKGWSPPVEGNPSLWLIMLLGVSVGLPFFIISASAPVLQRWFSTTRHSAAGDPYFLYVASNLGSIIGLIGYPVLLEPRLTLASQSKLWTWGYVALGVMIACCAVAALAFPQKKDADQQDTAPREPIRMMRRLQWILLAFVPSSLMISVTTHLTTDVASVPLLWMAPLALYLASFMLVFARRAWIPYKYFVFALPALILVQMVAIAGFPVSGMWPLGLHLLTFFAAAMACHGAMASDRPRPEHLTEFYLLMSLGGVLGGIFSAMLAPVVFNWVLEYPLMLAVAGVLASRFGYNKPWAIKRLDVMLPILILLGSFCLLMNTAGTGLHPGVLSCAAAIGCMFLVKYPVRFGLGLGLLMLLFGKLGAGGGEVIYSERSFFGVMRVKLEQPRMVHEFVHGTTLHGTQSLLPDWRGEPLSYFSRTGPVGDAFEYMRERHEKLDTAVIGLGIGTIACYALPGEEMTFFEIDPAVSEVAWNTDYFTFLSDARDRGADIRVVLGDARLTMSKVAPASYDLLILDAFSSDAIPIHLLTREAMQIYISKLRENGLLIINISNCHLDLRPQIAALAADAGLACRFRNDDTIDREDKIRGKDESLWAALARSEKDMGGLANDPRWRKFDVPDGYTVWTDDFSNILSVLRWD